MRLVRVLLLAVLLGALPGLARGAPPDLTGDGLDRGALLSLPGVYKVTVTVTATGIRTADRRTFPLPAGARLVRDYGTAFAVGPDGWLVTAHHVIVPDSEALAVPFLRRQYELEGRPHPLREAQEFARENGAYAVGLSHPPMIEVRQAAAGPDARRSKSYAIDPDRTAWNEDTDLALIRIVRAQGAPTLPLLDRADADTPIVTIGFGRDGAFAERGRGELEPALRRGRLGETRRLIRQGNRPMILISSEVRPGDSGGPAVDSEGRVRGVVLVRLESGGAIEPVSSLVELMGENRVAVGANPTAEAFRAGVDHIQHLQFADAVGRFDETLRLFQDHTLAEVERTRAEELQRARFDLVAPTRRRGLLTALGVTSGLLALACGLGLVRLRRRQPAPAGQAGAPA